MARKDLFNYRKLVVGIVLPVLLIILLVQALSAQQSIAAAEIEVTKTVDRELARRGDTVQYSISMNNVGIDPANTVTMTDTVPSDLTVITASVTGGYDSWGIDGNVITWTGSISENEGVDISIDTVVSETAVFDAPIINTVYVTGTGSLLSDEAIFTTTEYITHTLFMPILFKAPPAPTMLSVSPPASSDGYNTFQFTINWSNEGSGRYELQESQTPDFANPTVYDAGNATSYVVNHGISNDNEYYYRVRFIVNNLSSGWSNVLKQYGPYIDNFNDPSTGWKLRREDLDDTDNTSFYRDGNYVMKIKGRWDFAIGGPMVKVPWNSYRIEARMRFDDGVDNLHSYGLIWGGNWDGITACPNSGFTSCLNHYYRLNVLWYGSENQLRTQIKRIDYHDKDGAGRGESLAGYADNGVNRPSGGWQIWAIEQYQDGKINMLINGSVIRTVYDDTYVGAGTYFGVLATSNEYAGTEPWVDWIRVSPLP